MLLLDLLVTMLVTTITTLYNITLLYSYSLLSNNNTILYIYLISVCQQILHKKISPQFCLDFLPHGVINRLSNAYSHILIALMILTWLIKATATFNINS